MGIVEDLEKQKKDLEELKEIINPKEKLKEKKFKLPFRSRVKSRRAKKNWISILKVNENGHINATRKQILDQTIQEDGVPRLATNQYVMWIKKNPVIFLPSWSVEPVTPNGESLFKPFNPKEHLETSLINGTNIKGYKILLASMINNTTDKKKELGGIFKWIMIVAGIGLIAYIFFSGGFS